MTRQELPATGLETPMCGEYVCYMGISAMSRYCDNLNFGEAPLTPQNAISYHTKFAWFNWNYNNKIWVEYVPTNARGGGGSGTITINRNRILC